MEFQQSCRHHLLVSAILVLSMVLSTLPAYGDKINNLSNNITTATFTSSSSSITIPKLVFVSPYTGGISIKNKWFTGANISFSYYSINNTKITNDTNRQEGSIGYIGIFARYGITEELMLSGELDYLYGRAVNNMSGTTTNTYYSGFPISVNLLLFVPMNSFSIYSGMGPVYLAHLNIKQDMNGRDTNNIHGFGAGAQGIIGIETYLSRSSSINVELRYRHINLYKSDNKFIAPLNNLSIGLGLISSF